MIGDKWAHLNLDLSHSPWNDGDIRAMVRRLRHGEITDEKVEWLAAAHHRLVGWAGTPVAWADDGRHWNEERRERARATARWVLENGLPE